MNLPGGKGSVTEGPHSVCGPAFGHSRLTARDPLPARPTKRGPITRSCDRSLFRMARPAKACRQGAARRVTGRGRTARFPRCCRARCEPDHAPRLHRCGHRPRRRYCGHCRSRFRRLVPEVKIGTTVALSGAAFLNYARFICGISPIMLKFAQHFCVKWLPFGGKAP